MDVTLTQLQMQLRDHQNAMIEQGLMNPEFVERVKDLDSTMKLDKTIGMCRELLCYVFKGLDRVPPDFGKVLFHAGRHRSMASRFGAARAKNLWVCLQDYGEAQDLEKCFEVFQQLLDEYALLKENLERLITLQQEIAAYGVSIPTLQ